MIHPIKNIKASFRMFIATVKDNTLALQALAVEQKQLREKFDALVADSNFMVTTKKRELQRLGHRV